MSGGYRPPSSEPRGTWAKAIHRKRRADNISQQRAFELLAAKLGLGPKSRAAYVALDMGHRQPTEAEAAILADWLGGYPTDEPIMASSGTATTPPELAALIAEQTAALREQTAAFVTLAQSIDRAAAAVTGRVGDFGEDLEALVSLLRSQAKDGSEANGDGDPGPSSSRPGHSGS